MSAAKAAALNHRNWPSSQKAKVQGKPAHSIPNFSEPPLRGQFAKIQSAVSTPAQIKKSHRRFIAAFEPPNR